MTDEDKKIVADYMEWQHEYGRRMNFDLNDAGLVVQEMQKRGGWQDFVQTAAKIHKLGFHSEVVAWLFNAENFFKAFT